MLALAGTSAAAWSVQASGSAGAAARTMPAGSAPTATVPTLSTSVTVTWPASAFAGGQAVDGYVVTRYNAVTGALSTPGPGCGGVVHATTCTETGVSVGQWKYSVTPAQGGWRGTESALGNTVTVPGI